MTLPDNTVIPNTGASRGKSHRHRQPTIKGLMDVDHIDMVMANAGGAGAKGIIPLDVASPEIVTGCVYREGSRSIGPVPGCQASVGEGSSSQVGVCEQCCGFDWST
ncbi:hypothetical protein ASPCADRAFT_10495 [Aspergillus carbonarius ITEM 5010]|uniref:Uncharacterized protein n=1 Tax=Aspergillus carbonarius (strain ITEM 5010) TaxID=602072 RepID=A0A1R3R7W8_ASPC5|nr:hypothetical protein ASPCADRAFT_10495 [Aspergillus carbonarius ITEM 5010]